ncbi:MAG: peptidoglycan DD-metalloendopeptidase family protein [Alphaproteobacteria bacterium]
MAGALMAGVLRAWRRACLVTACALLVLAACLPLPAVEQDARTRPLQPTAATASGVSGGGPGMVVVRSGDTVYALARRFGVSQRALIEANGLRPPFRLSAGQSLTVPTPTTYRVQAGDTVYGIANRFGVDQVSLARANGLGAEARIQVGQLLTLPATVVTSTTSLTGDAAQSESAAASIAVAAQTLDSLEPEAAESVVVATTQPAQSAAATDSLANGSAGITPAAGQGLPTISVATRPRAAVRGPLADPPARAGTFLWPVEGQVVARFGPGEGGLQNDGINIRAARGTPVLAAENGTVVYAGNEIRGFGNLVLIRHADGWLTAYGHNDVLAVRRGDVVRRGQTIARVGSTGNVGEPQLHFEVRRHSRPVDPADVGLTRPP